MYVHADQIAAWEYKDLRAWLCRAFPERVLGRPDADIAAYLDSRIAQARALRFTALSHLRFLIGYELGSGVRWMPETGPAGDPQSASLLRVRDELRRKQTRPDARIAAVERLLYGRS